MKHKCLVAVLRQLVLLLSGLTAVASTAASLQTVSEQQLWQRLRDNASVSLGGSSWTWRGDQQVILTSQATISGPGTLSVETLNPVVTGASNGASLTLRNLTLFYSNGVLASAVRPPLSVASGPIPAINASSLGLSFIDVTLMAPFGPLVSVAGFWSSTDILASLSDLSGATSGSASPLQQAPHRIASYSSSGIGISQMLLLPTDQKPTAVECFAGGVPVYDSASMRSAMDAANPTVFVYQDILLSPADFIFTNPVNISGNTTTLEVYSCAGTAIDLNYNWTRFSLEVGNGGTLVLRNLTFNSAPNVNQLFWPRRMPPLLGWVYAGIQGNVNLTSVTINCEDAVDVATDVGSYDTTNPNTTNTTAATSTYIPPTYTAINATHVHIARWRLTGDVLWPYSPGVSTEAAAASAWDLTDVTVSTRGFTGCVSSLGVQGIKISTGKQLRQLIGDDLMPAFEIVADIEFIASEWPPEASGPDAGQIFVNKNVSKEIFACPPAPGKRYTINFGNLGQVVFVFGTLRFRGALQMTNPRASPRRSWLYLLIGALSAETDGVILFDRVAITSNVSSAFTNASDPFWATSCGTLCPTFIPQENTYVNATAYDAFIFTYMLNKSAWVKVSQGRDIVGAGYWGYTDVSLTWRPDPPLPPPPPAPPSLPPSPPLGSKDADNGGGSDVPVAAIAAPVAVGGTAALVAVAVLAVWARRRAAGKESAADAVYGRTGSGASGPAGGGGGGGGGAGGAGYGTEGMLPLPPSSQINTMAPSGTLLSKATSQLSASAPTEARIEDMKRALTSQAALQGTQRNEQITLTELLGEGSFGKVYRGTWRGTTVAVKTMVLPTNMSGKEKREKMAIMETAISSSLSHPNIVQTYTYAVLAVKGDAGALDTKLAAGTSLTVDSTSPLSVVANAETTNIHSWEVRLVLEFCDRGSLRDVLNEALVSVLKSRGLSSAPPPPPEEDTASTPSVPGEGPPAAGALGGLGQQPRQQAALLPGGEAPAAGGQQQQQPAGAGGSAGQLPSMVAHKQCPLGFGEVLEVSLDVARAMLHMHSENIVHGDLKARNILLKSSGGADGRKYVAKVADFGLSLRIDPHETHVSNVYQGTITHMAPEVLLHGKVSKASDVYAFAILMWETYTAGQAFKGTPRALLGHEVTKMNRRPQFPYDTPFEFQLLACRCWESDASIRPTFEQIIGELSRMKTKLTAAVAGGGGKTGSTHGGSGGVPFSGPRAVPDGSHTSSCTENGDPSGLGTVPGTPGPPGLGGGMGPHSLAPLPAVLPLFRPGAAELSVTLEADTGSLAHGSTLPGQELFYMQGIDGSSAQSDLPVPKGGGAGYSIRPPGAGPAAGGAAAARTPAMPPIQEAPLPGPHGGQ